jgi:hypothetical protein
MEKKQKVLLVQGDHKKYKQERYWLINENTLITV